MAKYILKCTKLWPKQYVMLFIPKESLVFFNQYLPIEEKRKQLCVLRVSRERSERVVK